MFAPKKTMICLWHAYQAGKSLGQRGKKGKISTFFVVCDVTASREDLDDKFELAFYVPAIVPNPMMGHFLPKWKRTTHWLLKQNQ